mgnify:CR=1 FL=1
MILPTKGEETNAAALKTATLEAAAAHAGADAAVAASAPQSVGDADGVEVYMRARYVPGW